MRSCKLSDKSLAFPLAWSVPFSCDWDPCNYKCYTTKWRKKEGNSNTYKLIIIIHDCFALLAILKAHYNISNKNTRKEAYLQLQTKGPLWGSVSSRPDGPVALDRSFKMGNTPGLSSASMRGWSTSPRARRWRQMHEMSSYNNTTQSLALKNSVLVIYNHGGYPT